MYKTIIDNESFEITDSQDGHVVNGVPFRLDILSISENSFHILHGNTGYRAEIVKSDPTTKSFTIKINGRLYVVEVKDKYDLLLEKMGMKDQGAGKLNNIKAPMPGLIIDMKVKEGDVVKQNDPLLILEAMKMENIIKSPGDAVVKSVKVKKGMSVEKNQILIEF